MSNYTSKTNVERYLNVDLPDALDVSAWLNAIDNWIENYLGRSFKDISSATKYYDCSGGKEIYIDNFEGNPSSVIFLDADGDNDTTLTIDEDYRIFPLNETIKNKLVLMENGRRSAFPTGEKRLSVTANFGVTTAPADIVLAATKLLGEILNKYLKGGKTKSETVGDVSFTYADIDEAASLMGVTNILDQYRHFQI